MTYNRINFFFLNVGHFFDHMFVLIFAEGQLTKNALPCDKQNTNSPRQQSNLYNCLTHKNVDAKESLTTLPVGTRHSRPS